MLNKISLILIGICLSISAIAETNIATIVAGINNKEVSVYQKNEGDDTFQIISRYSKSKIVSQTRDITGNVQEDEQIETNTSVPGVDVKGYNTYRFVKKNDNYYMLANVYEVIEVEGKEIEYRNQEIIDVKFTSGNWNEYLAGNKVELTVPEEEINKLLKSAGHKLDKTMQAALNEQATNLRIDSTLKPIDSSPEINFTVEGDTLEYRSNNIQLILILDLYM